ncbi:TIGR01244 family sulfur transferase [Leptothrix discophora]|uniref:TIGR01244 family sulfur transferase n=1 Tax=Leptothrix discophora TaxID=89 RepID=A0ABT9FZI8_LEPDI|nr:TIGR01244 family sulfur transferase [Leptothrix discophora]MDP4299650.1 TIGR01244 family sulfur transferase [Leptothrix discophora]
MNAPLLPVQPLNANISVAPQLMPEAMAAAAAAGFRSVINNRPDFEGGPDQPTSAQMEAAALAAGLRYAHLPVSGAWQSPEEIAEFKRLIDELPAPVLAFCRSGARSGRLYAQACELG